MCDPSPKSHPCRLTVATFHSQVKLIHKEANAALGLRIGAQSLNRWDSPQELPKIRREPILMFIKI